MDLLDIATRVKRGVRLLDKKYPTWRKVMAKHADRFNLQAGDYCVLGTLEQHLGKLRVAARKGQTQETGSGYTRAVNMLKLDGRGEEFGFVGKPNQADGDRSEDYGHLEALWRAEFMETK